MKGYAWAFFTLLSISVKAQIISLIYGYDNQLLFRRPQAEIQSFGMGNLGFDDPGVYYNYSPPDSSPGSYPNIYVYPGSVFNLQSNLNIIHQTIRGEETVQATSDKFRMMPDISILYQPQDFFCW